MIARQDCVDRDAADVTAPLRDRFALPEGVVYLDGNSLGPLPKAARARLETVLTREWGDGLVRSWNAAGWIDLAHRVGDKIARVIGAGEGEVVVADSTSVNLYKALCAALALARLREPARNVVVTERQNFPTDLYIAQSVARERGASLRFLDRADPARSLDATVAVLMLTQVDYRTGCLHDMAALNRAAHGAGALTLWDLSHSAGVVPIALQRDDADFAVGCGYKYLNGGPGAPAFVWAHPRHTAAMDAHGLAQPLSGWLGHAAPFAFAPEYRPAAGIARFACGTPPILSLAALECGVDTVLAADAIGGMNVLWQKCKALTECFVALVDAQCADAGLTLVTPRDPDARGSQVSYTSRDDGYAIMQALIERGVIGDFRAPDLLRFGFSPLHTRFVDAWDAVACLREVIASGAWREPRFRSRERVT